MCFLLVCLQMLGAIVGDGTDSPDKLVLPPHCPPAYAALVSACRARSPKDRPTMAEVLARLEGAEMAGEWLLPCAPLPGFGLARGVLPRGH